MLNTQHLPPYMFSLEGNFLGYLGKSPTKIKALILEFEQEQLAIKLPKPLRMSLQAHNLQLGDQIRCIGRSQVDFKSGVIKLKAYHVVPLKPPSEDRFDAPTPPTPALVASEAAPAAVFAGKKRAKILVCRKSGCQKRGGGRLISTLETLLQEYQLQDHVEIQYTGCQKRCSKAPTLTIMPGKHRYDRLASQNISHLIEQHFCPSERCSSN
ncbi:MAG: (2Fe-2S) ferredoxin domain-containing protein [Cyanobacteria bacterium P01_H01_bin.21]